MDFDHFGGVLISGARLVWRHGRKAAMFQQAVQDRGGVNDGSRFLNDDIVEFPKAINPEDPAEEFQCFRVGRHGTLTPVARGSWEAK